MWDVAKAAGMAGLKAALAEEDLGWMDVAKAAGMAGLKAALAE